jgi:hypothetical protein
MSWLRNHLETFVAPVLGYIPEKALSKTFTAKEMVAIKNTWRSVKRQAVGKRLVLTGRDTYIFEILARRENFPTVYIPQCSRVTKGKVDMPKDGCLLFDTGFVGSIPKFYGVDYILLSEHRKDVQKQIYPNMKFARDLASKIECSSKYWESARIINGEVVQNISGLDKFLKAAQLTIEIYTDSTPTVDFALRRNNDRRSSNSGTSQESPFAHPKGDLGFIGSSSTANPWDWDEWN